LSVVLDASAVLARLQQERGADEVKDMFVGGIITAANRSEVLQKVGGTTVTPFGVGPLLRALGLEVNDVVRLDDERAADLWERSSPLSLADRLCLAVAHRLGVRAVTAESRWTEIDAGVEVHVMR
jgi:ribonuclease VapC